MSDPRHTYRYPQHRYEAAKAKAAIQGRTVTEVIVERLDQLVDTPPFTRGERLTIEVTAPVDMGPAVDEEPMLDQMIDELGQDKPPSTTTFAFHAEPEVQCRAMDGRCDCHGFNPHPKSQLRCQECGHGIGIHN